MNSGDPPERQVLRLSLVFFLLAASAQATPPADGKLWWPKGGRQPRSYHHLEGDVRWRQLYSSTHFFLSLDGSGKVQGTRRKDCLNTIVEIRSVNVGIVAIRSVHSGFYLAMNRKGRVYGTKEYSPNCKFKERIEENGYNTYSSFHWHHKGRPMFISLNRKGIPQRGINTRRQRLSTHFLPLTVF